MKIENLKPAQGATTKKVRVGRGIGSGIGKTSGKGHKGQWARSGGGVKAGFEGGNIPMIRKIPIRGFNNFNSTKVYSTVTLEILKYLNQTQLLLKNSCMNIELLEKDNHMA